MKKSLICMILATVLLCCALSGCSEAVGEIAGNVAEVAKAELEAQVKAAFEKRLRKYPVLTDAESEKSLMKLVEQTYERRKAQENAE